MIMTPKCRVCRPCPCITLRANVTHTLKHTPASCVARSDVDAMSGARQRNAEAANNWVNSRVMKTGGVLSTSYSLSPSFSLSLSLSTLTSARARERECETNYKYEPLTFHGRRRRPSDKVEAKFMRDVDTVGFARLMVLNAGPA